MAESPNHQRDRLRVEVIVKDINDNPPTFEKDLYSAHVKEEQTQGVWDPESLTCSS